MERNMGPDGQLDAKGPVRLNTVKIVHAGIFRHNVIDGFSDLPCNVQKDLPTRNVVTRVLHDSGAKLS